MANENKLTTLAQMQEFATRQDARDDQQDEQLRQMQEGMPSVLPNPHTLTFTGAASGSYDGSEDVSIDIPRSDWNQSDHEAKDYIKNRPFYDALEETTVVREFDGNVKVIDAEFCGLLFEQRSAANYIFEGNTCDYAGGDYVHDGGWSYRVSDGTTEYYVMATKGESGIIDSVVVMTGGGTWKTGTISFTAEVMVPHKLDEKYIPDTIARTENVPVVNAISSAQISALFAT